MDVFVEQLIVKKGNSRDLLIKSLVVMVQSAIVFLSIYFIMFLSAFIIPILVGSFYGFWYINTAMNIEFEYSVTNGYVTVDQIAGKRKRKRLVAFESREVEAFGIFRPELLGNSGYKTKLLVGSSMKAEQLWYAVFSTQKTGRTILVFEPEQRVLDAIKPALPRQVAIDAFGRN